jgi:GDP/UDP-N,N'-diacetylbacillosamine 2-epimerase (hydrolysing)
MTEQGKKATRQRGNKKKRPLQQRQIAVVTGTRAEYGLLKSTMTALQKHANVKLQLVVTGSHLLPKFGSTIDEIVADGWQIDARVPMQCGNDDPYDQAQGLARGVAGIARFLHDFKTDIVVVLGDRIEAMAAALAAITTSRMLAHIHGGDLAAGDLDDALRHSITKLAHIHFPATREAARRIVRMGEPSWRVHKVGAPGLDRICELLAAKSQTISDAACTLQAPFSERHAIILQHPSGRRASRERSTMTSILRAVHAEGYHATCIYPNTDHGHEGILGAITAHEARASNGEFRVVPSLPRDDFLLAMHKANVLVGNSSSGIIEAASVGTPAINIGKRQNGRQVSGANVIHCDETFDAIRNALREAARRRKTRACSAVYGDGHAGERIAKVLARIPLNDTVRRKLNAY